jgi:hypothetical protein
VWESIDGGIAGSAARIGIHRTLGRLQEHELFEDFFYANAVDRLHCVVVNSLVAANTQDRHNIRVVQTTSRLCFVA